MANQTTLVIAHQLSTVLDADQIVVLENGIITGIGKHTDLIETDIFYKRLAHQQLKNPS